jgi:hypothetical protein
MKNSYVTTRKIYIEIEKYVLIIPVATDQSRIGMDYSQVLQLVFFFL